MYISKIYKDLKKQTLSINVLKAWLLFLLGLGVAACSDDIRFNDNNSSENGIVTINLRIPSFTVKNLSTRAGDEPELGKVVLYAITGDTYTKPEVSLSGNIIKFEKNDDANRYELVIYPDGENYDTESLPYLNISNDATKDILWGTFTKSDLESDNFTVNLLRHNAKVSVLLNGDNVEVENQSADFDGNSFILNGFDVFGVASTGTIAPSAENYATEDNKVSAPTIPSSVDYNLNLSDSKPSKSELDLDPVEIFESEKGKGKIIIKGTYNGTVGYYPIAFAERKKKTGASTDFSEDPETYEYENIDILRNHWYKVNVEYVRAEGWKTLEEAYAAKPDNRITVQLTDETAEIVDIIACRDYALGVSEPDPVIAWSEEADGSSMISVYAVTSYTGTPQISFEAKSDWFSIQGNPESSSIENNETKYTVEVMVLGNKDQKVRTGYITVVSGDLKREIKITQKGYDIYRAADRKVELAGTPITSGEDVWTEYFSWLDKCFGVTPEENRGTVRNQGLHFPAVPVFTLKYRIPKLSGDREESVSGNGFSVWSDDSYFYVTASNELGIALGTVQFTNSEGQIIQYDLYKTGVFHELTQNVLNQYAMPGENVTPGWYYYELVNANGVYILDRNIGAKTNAAYKSTSSVLRNNEGARGAYFKIAEQREDNKDKSKMGAVESSKTIVSNLGLPGNYFKAPLQTQLERLGVTATNAGSTRETAIVATVLNVTGEVTGNKIYFPHCGYYDDASSEYKNDSHANVWTRSLHCYSQGFDSQKSDEFGYWYRCFDGYGSTVGATQMDNISQIRFVDGSGKDFPTNPSYRYMPIRLVWDTSELGSNDREGAPFEMKNYRIYWPKSFGEKIHLWSSDYDSSGNGTWNSGMGVSSEEDEVKVFNDFYYYRDFTTDWPDGLWYQYNGIGSLHATGSMSDFSYYFEGRYHGFLDNDNSNSNGNFNHLRGGIPANEIREYVDIYLRGGFSNWNALSNYQFYKVKDDSEWRTDIISITSGTEFKIADSNWNLDLGAHDNVYGLRANSEPYECKVGSDSKNFKMNGSFTGYAKLIKSGNKYSLTLISQ